MINSYKYDLWGDHDSTLKGTKSESAYSKIMTNLYKLFWNLQPLHVRGFHRFSCCGGCGHKYFIEKGMLLEELKQDSKLQGYVFYDTKKHNAFIANLAKPENSEELRLKLHIGSLIDSKRERSKIIEALFVVITELELDFDIEPSPDNSFVFLSLGE